MTTRRTPHDPTDEPIRLALIGAGERGSNAYGRFSLDHPDAARFVAVAEVNPARRDRFGDAHRLPSSARFTSWDELIASDIAFDALIIATPDSEHEAPVTAALGHGHHILVEKPLAPDEGGVRRIAAAARTSAGSLSVAHELRYAPFFADIKRTVTGGRIGDLIGIDLVENIGYWHFAHSYVRGNWRRSDLASPMILSKACHDLDILRWLADAPPTSVTSSGSLNHFRADHAPAGAPARCLDGCPVAATCPFNAVPFYMDAEPGTWPVSVLTSDAERRSVRDALAWGPYGRCVYRCDNDVVDHQVALFEFSNGVRATFTASAFSAEVTRSIKVFGTHGEIRGSLHDGAFVLRTFRPGPIDARTHHVAGGDEQQIPVGTADSHGGGDTLMLQAFVGYLRARARGNASVRMATSIDVSIDSHLMAFAAERSRSSRSVVEIMHDVDESA